MPAEPARVFPTLRTPEVEAVIRWLIDVVGFREIMVHRDGDIIGHAELAYGPSIVMLGAERDDDFGRLVGRPGARRTDAIYVAVDDIDALAEAVARSGAPIEMPLADMSYGSREFVCRDPGGNLWSFGTYRPAADG